MSLGHLSDDRLIELSMGCGSPSGEPHLTGCAECRSRHAALTQLLDEVDEVAAAEVASIFPAERLARQRVRILQRIDQVGRTGRLIAFPSVFPRPPLLARSGAATRWVAAAAVAGLVVGLLTGQLLQTSRMVHTASEMVSNEAGDSGALRAVSTTLSDDEFLGQVEVAAGASPASLHPLDVLTPRAWEVTR